MQEDRNERIFVRLYYRAEHWGGDRIVAIAIIPTEGGWPDAAQAAAYTPVYPLNIFPALTSGDFQGRL
jgi:hypothetical protein